MSTQTPPLPSPGLVSLRDLNDLEVFARVVEKSGFTKAAQELGVPASTVSRRVARLEETLGVRLLQRTTRTLALTEAGRVYFERVSRALHEIEQAELALRNEQGTPRGRVRLTTVSEPFLDQVLFEFLDLYPEVELEIDMSHRRVDLVAEGYDLAVRAGSLPDSSLIAHKLLSSRSLLCASSAYVDRHGLPGSLSELRDRDCVVLGSTGTSFQLDTGRGLERVAVRTRIAVNNLGTAISATKRGLGIGLLPWHMISEELASGALIELLPEYAAKIADLWVVYPSRSLQPPAVKALIEHIRASFRRAAGSMPEPQ